MDGDGVAIDARDVGRRHRPKGGITPRAKPLLVIHAGLRKAGSSTIQSFLSDNETALRLHGIDFTPAGRPMRDNAENGRRKGHHAIALEILRLKRFDAALGSPLADLAASRRTNGARVTILSSEMFEELDATQTARLQQAITADDLEVRVVLYLRNYVELIQSSYTQKIRYGSETYDFDRFYKWRIAHKRADYFSTVENWAQTFGWENVRVRLLEARNLVNEDLIEDFLTAIGVNPDEAWAQSLVRPGVINAGSGWRVLEATRALFGGFHRLPESHPLVTMASRAKPLGKRRTIAGLAAAQGARLGWNEDKGCYLTRAQARDCLATFQTSIVKLNQVLPYKLPRPQSLEERGFKPRRFMPEAACISQSELADFYEGLTAAFLATPGLARMLADNDDTASRPARRSPGGAERSSRSVDVGQGRTSQLADRF